MHGYRCYSQEKTTAEASFQFLSLKELDLIVKNEEIPKLDQFYKTFVKKDLRKFIVTSSFKMPVIPEEVTYISFVLNNPFKEKKSGKIKVIYPKEWKSISKKEISYSLNGNSSSPQIFAVKIPGNTKPGLYPVKLELTGDLTDQMIFHGDVSKFVVLKGSLSEIKSSYTSLEKIKTELTLTNEGNVDLKLKIDTYCSPLAVVDYPLGVINLKAKKSVKIQLKVHPSQLPHQYNQYCLFKIVNIANNQTIYTKNFSTSITPSHLAPERNYESIPGYIETTALLNNSHPVAIVELAGKGMMDQKGSHSLDFFFRVPSNINRYIYDSYQRLFLEFSSPIYKIFAGDTNYNLTPLTQSRYGRGLGLMLSPRWFKIGAQYTQNPYHKGDNPQEIAAFINFLPTKAFSLSGNFLKKNVKHSTLSEIFTANAQIKMGQKNYTELEIANNTHFSGNFKNTGAAYLNTRGKWSKESWYSVNTIYAGPLFFGYYQNTKILGATVSFPWGKKIRNDWGFNYTKRNYDESMSNKKFFNLQKQITGSISYNIFNGSYLFLKGWSVKSLNTSTNPNDWIEYWGSFSWNHAVQNFGASLGAQCGAQTNYLTNQTSDILKRFNLNVQKDWGFCSLNGFYQIGNNNFFDVSNWNIFYGGSLAIKYRGRNQFVLSANRSRNSKQYVDTSAISLKWSHEFLNNHLMEVKYDQYIAFNKAPNSSFFVFSYKIPFGIPVGRRKDIGKVKGKITNQWNNAPVAGVLVELQDKKVYSNEQGEFVFPMIPIGSHDLKVSILSNNLVEKERNSPKIEVCSNKESYVEVAAVPYCQIKGFITTYEYEDSPETLQQILEGKEVSPIEKCKQSGIEIFVENNHTKEVFRTTSDAKGSFAFPRLKPGAWHVYISDKNLPELTFLEKQDLDLEIDPEEIKNISINILPVKFVPLQSASSP